MIDFHGRLRCPRCNSRVFLDWETDRPVLACLSCSWSVEGSSARERQMRAELAEHQRGPLTPGPRRRVRA